VRVAMEYLTRWGLLLSAAAAIVGLAATVGWMLGFWKGRTVAAALAAGVAAWGGWVVCVCVRDQPPVWSGPGWRTYLRLGAAWAWAPAVMIAW
jgi:hypothetical protein